MPRAIFCLQLWNMLRVGWKKKKSCYKSPPRLIYVNWGYSASMISHNQQGLLSERNEGLRKTSFFDNVAMLSSLLIHDLVRMLQASKNVGYHVDVLACHNNAWYNAGNRCLVTSREETASWKYFISHWNTHHPKCSIATIYSTTQWENQCLETAKPFKWTPKNMKSCCDCLYWFDWSRHAIPHRTKHVQLIFS